MQESEASSCPWGCQSLSDPNPEPENSLPPRGSESSVLHIVMQGGGEQGHPSHLTDLETGPEMTQVGSSSFYNLEGSGGGS